MPGEDTGQKGCAPLEIYVHIPFCIKKCDYCDFLSGPAGAGKQRAYVKALLAEIRGLLDTAGHEVTSVFFGGGTPSVMEPELIAEILHNLRSKFLFSPDAEVTIEANPGTLTRDKLAVYREAGINRLSLGLQSADDRELRELGRIHSFSDFLESFRLAREAGFSNINVDLMFAIPGQSPKGWERTLRTVAGLGPEHISAYSLIVEEGTPFASRELELPDEEEEYAMYDDTGRILKEYGYHPYEISNYAKEGMECRHNLGYWRRTEYLGLGLGSASLYDETRFSNTSDMEEYLSESGRPERIRKETQRLTEQEQMEEFMFLGLRTTKGIREGDFEKRFGRTLEAVYGRVLSKYESMGFMERSGGWRRFTKKGIHVSNTILAEFLL